MRKKCLYCGVTFYKKNNESKIYWHRKKFCSKDCANLGKIGINFANSGQFKKNQKPWNKNTKGLMNIWNKGLKGIHLSPKSEWKTGHKPWTTGKKRLEITGDNHWFWKGDKAKYGTIHDWVYYHKGKPTKCDHCGKKGTTRTIHWANVDHKYRRDLSDWISLCISCHREHDKFL